MSREMSCGFEFIATPDLRGCLTEALHCDYSFIITPLIHPRYTRQHSSVRYGGFTRSDMLLSPQDWTVRVVGRISQIWDADVESPMIRQRHEDCITEELWYCKGLGLPAIMLPLHGSQSNNLARILLSYLESSHYSSFIWTRVPMACKRTLRNSKIGEPKPDELVDDPWNETWYWWSKFHERLDWDKRVGVVLAVTADLPSQDVIDRWLGEPVKALIIPTHLFQDNEEGNPILSEAHQKLVISMVEHEVQVIISGKRKHDIKLYSQFMQQLWVKRPIVSNDSMLHYASGWEDYLQTPLQPLADNLDAYTYNVFETDPVKYSQYQKAIAKALLHFKRKATVSPTRNPQNGDLPQEIDEQAEVQNLIGNLEIGQGDNNDLKKDQNTINSSQVEKTEDPVVVMVLGAGRGPLVRATLNASDITKTKVKVIAVEKNPCAVVVLAAQVREIWRNHDVSVVAGDMRRLNLDPKADIIVSELLGSWGDNELSPECLDGAAGLLKPGGISIPNEYTSYVAPIASACLWAAAKSAITNTNKEKNLETLWVVYMQNKQFIGDTKPVFKFEHPAKGVLDSQGQEMTDWRGLPLTDNRRLTTITWDVAQDNVLHGFGGYFDCSLYGGEMISIVPSTHSPDMISWFPVFIPIKTPIRVKRGEQIKAMFWRCVDSRKVWYEWVVEVGDQMTGIHNANGRSSEMLL